MKNKYLSRKKGIGLVECVVALMLFSIVTVSVLSVFTASRNQVQKQNDEFKSDLLQNNIVAAYEASEDYNNMANILGWATKDEADDSPMVPLAGGNGNGSIPVKNVFDKITVDTNAAGTVYATFKRRDRNEDGTYADTYTSLISFEGDYANNRLQPPTIPAGFYDETSVRIPRELVLLGKAHPTLETVTGAYDYTYTVNENTVKFEMGKGVLEKDATDLDRYFLNNGWYLKPVKASKERYDSEANWGKGWLNIPVIKDYTITLYRDFYYEVLDINGNSTNQYICVSSVLGQTVIDSLADILTFIPQFSNSIGDNFTYSGSLQDYYDNKALESTYIDLSLCTVRTASGKSVPNFNKFTELNPTGYNLKTGNWYFSPWLAYRDGVRFTPGVSAFEPGRTYYEYSPKEGKASDFYYLLKSDDKVEMYNSDSVKIFTYTGNATKIDAALNGNTCQLEEATTVTPEDVTYDVWYPKGKMPGKVVTTVVCDDAKKEIVLYSDDGQPFIRFIYIGPTSYASDKTLILSGEYSGYYNVSGNTATLKSPGEANFSCTGFFGPYTVKINEEVILPSNATRFEIRDYLPMSEETVSYGMIGEPVGGEVSAKIYYAASQVTDSDLWLVSKITFCELAKPKEIEGVMVEPGIKIWSLSADDYTALVNGSGLETIESCTDADLQCTFRKG